MIHIIKIAEMPQIYQSSTKMEFDPSPADSDRSIGDEDSKSNRDSVVEPPAEEEKINKNSQKK